MAGKESRTREELQTGCRVKPGMTKEAEEEIKIVEGK